MPYSPRHERTFGSPLWMHGYASSWPPAPQNVRVRDAGELGADERKTRELLAAGFRVARIRESDLAHLALEAPTVRQVSFRPAFGSLEEIVEGLVRWATRGFGAARLDRIERLGLA